ncbi:50S ribosomal protein L13 [Candidatus Woesebacteria bacterium RBG_13_34_9]|uniref:Large ribosomal subunit protein uL13 n=1 Tax=Candidatus Woesebacteria bacterium RBG_13_34_9 TaxID=1802477 RepID=A0A1F7X301_9BACT|nr:MAG: 50S ribosomal protein L13 [Candidatus Woesebacteria bacterium RBG_13_34_9]
MNSKTYQPKAKEVKRDWHLMDAKGQILGRLASQIAVYLMGKHKSVYSNHMDMGDYVVVINAKDIKLTGKKTQQKLYRSHSGYPGGFKEVKFEKLINENPNRVIQKAVSGMLPDNRLKSKRILRLKIFSDENYTYKDKFKDEKIS